MDRSAVQGFTLIELMIVIAIIAVFVALALPAYQDYIIKSRVSEALVLASGLRATIVVNASQGNPDLAAGTALTQDSDASPNVTWTDVDADNGTITVQTRARAGNGTLTLTPTAEGGAPLVAGIPPVGNIMWACTSGLPQKYLASTCAGAAGP